MRKLQILGVLLLLLVSFLTETSAQSRQQAIDTESDTLHVAITDSITVPQGQRYADVWSPVMKGTYSVSVLDASGKTIPNQPRILSWIYPPKNGHGGLHIYVVRAMFSQPGLYLIRRQFDAFTESNTRAQIIRQVVVKAEYPTVLNSIPKELDSALVFNQPLSFSFTTADFKNSAGYSYTISSGNQKLYSAPGSFVSLDTLVLNKEANVGKKITITGFYQGQPFTFIDPKTKTEHKSEWTFTITPPALTWFTPWVQVNRQQFNPGRGLLNLDPQDSTSFNPKEIRCMYASKIGTSYIYTTPKPVGLTVESSNTSFIGENDWDYHMESPWLVITLRPKPTFLQSIGTGYANVDVTIRFRTQFGENVDETFKASIF